MAWITAAEALALLQVQAQTLYANVSRGRIRARRDADDPRRSQYLREDVLRLARRRPGARRTETVAAGAIEWGDPVLPSAISTVIDGRLYYRGQDAVALAEHASLEAIASLLWEGPPMLRLPAHAAAPRGEASAPLGRAAAALAARLDADWPTIQRQPGLLHADAAAVFATLADALIGASRPSQPLAARVAAAWRRPQAADIIRRALVLLADHELNASTFAARVAASTGASLSASVLAGLCALSGPRHGGAWASAVHLVDAARTAGADQAVRDALAQGTRLAAFGHPLYPEGDCRAAALLACLELPRPYGELVRCVEEATGARPNVDFALAALTTVHRLPPQAPLVLFALARCAGWLAHALEQVRSEKLIRPRARYVGPAPEANATRERDTRPSIERGAQGR